MVDTEGATKLYHLDETDAFSLKTTRTSSDADSLEMTFQLTELQRVALLAKSGVEGGDGSAASLELINTAVRDQATNGNHRHSIVIEESPDIVLPLVLSATLDLDAGVLIVTSSEIIDTTPSTKINPSKLRLSNIAGNGDNTGVVLTNCVVTEGGLGLTSPGETPPSVAVDSYVFKLTLVEADRALVIAIAGETGGDNTAVVLDVIQTGALFDIAQNSPLVVDGIVVTETADVTKPRILNATITLGDGILVLLCSEYADLTPASTKVDLTKLHLSDTSGANDAIVPDLNGASVIEIDGYYLSITLTEEQRVDAIEHSATPGGDGVALIFDAEDSAVKDIAQNGNDATNTFYQYAHPGVLVTEHADLVAPTIVDVQIDYGLGIVQITASETVDTSNVDLTKLFLSDVSGTHDVPLGGAPATFYDANQATVIAIDGVKFNITLSELQRVTALAKSSTSGGNADNTPLVLDSPLSSSFTDIGQNPTPPQNNIPIREFGDALPPTFQSATLNYSTGTLIITADETIDTTPGT